MARLQNKGFTARAPQTAAQWPEMPDFSPQFSELDGGRTNAAFQRWSDLCSQRIGGNEQQNNGRFKSIQTTITRTNGYLESVWTMQAIAGPVVTGMTLFSSADPENNTFVSRVTFQADVFQINTASGNHKTVFSTSADAIKLGDVLTVDLANAKVFMGDGIYGDAATPFYVDSLGRLSVTDKFKWSGSVFTVAGWELNASTISKNNATLDSAGQLILGTANDIIYISATDATYRIWVGNVTAGTATFRVTKGGAVTATSGAIGGWTLSATTLSGGNAVLDSTGQLILGTANDIIYLSATDATYRLWVGNVTAGSAAFSVTKAGALFSTSGEIGGFNISAFELSVPGTIHLDSSGSITLGATSGGQGASIFDSSIQISNSTGAVVVLRLENLADAGVATFYTGGVAAITLDAATGAVTATSFAGSGASLTSLNASALTSGTLPNARLSFSATGTGDVPINGFVNVGGVKLATVA